MSRRGEVLGGQLTNWTEIRARARGATEEAELPAADLSFLSDLSDDGTQVLGTDTGQGGGPNFAFYLQKTDGSPPVWLGEGDGQAISPDGRFVLAVLSAREAAAAHCRSHRRRRDTHSRAWTVVRYSRAVWDPTGRRVVFSGFDKQESERVFVQDADGGPTEGGDHGRDVSLPRIGRPVSPDGRRVVALGPDGLPALYPLAGGEPVAIPGLTDNDVPICWTPDGRELWWRATKRRRPGSSASLSRAGAPGPGTGSAARPPAVFSGQYRILVTPDGESYAYGYNRLISDLYLTSPLH